MVDAYMILNNEIWKVKESKSQDQIMFYNQLSVRELEAKKNSNQESKLTSTPRKSLFETKETKNEDNNQEIIGESKVMDQNEDYTNELRHGETRPKHVEKQKKVQKKMYNKRRNRMEKFIPDNQERYSRGNNAHFNEDVD